MSALKQRFAGGNGRFVEYSKSGAVSVRLNEFLRSDAGKQQLKTAKELRDRIKANNDERTSKK